MLWRRSYLYGNHSPLFMPPFVNLRSLFERVYDSHPVVFPAVYCAINSIPADRPFPISTLFSQPEEEPKKLTPSLYSSTLRISL